MTITVKNCRSCPFVEHSFHGNVGPKHANCMAPVQIHVKYNVDSYFKNYKSPKWCPLKNKNLLIIHEKTS